MAVFYYVLITEISRNNCVEFLLSLDYEENHLEKTSSKM